jgi:hypothetical protein
MQNIFILFTKDLYLDDMVGRYGWAIWLSDMVERYDLKFYCFTIIIISSNVVLLNWTYRVSLSIIL